MHSVAPYDVRDVANYLLDIAEERKVQLSITSLLKIVYFAHGWHLADQRGPLIGQSFEAWQHGPVVRVLYDSFKTSSGSPITHRAKKFSAEQNSYILAESEFPATVKELLESILVAYGSYHPFHLSEMTHVADSPWTEVWEAGERGEAPGMKISDQKIKDYFLRKNVGDTFLA